MRSRLGLYTGRIVADRGQQSGVRNVCTLKPKSSTDQGSPANETSATFHTRSRRCASRLRRWELEFELDAGRRVHHDHDFSAQEGGSEEEAPAQAPQASRQGSCDNGGRHEHSRHDDGRTRDDVSAASDHVGTTATAAHHVAYDDGEAAADDNHDPQDHDHEEQGAWRVLTAPAPVGASAPWPAPRSVATQVVGG